VKTEAPTGVRALRYPAKWPSLIDRMASFAVVPGDGPETVRTKKLFTTAMWVSLFTTGASVFQFYGFDAPLAALAVSAPMVVAGITLFLMWLRPTAYPGVMHLVATSTMVTSVAMIVMFGGVFASAGSSTWSVLAMLGAVAVFADKRAHFWLVMFVFTTLLGFALAAQIEPIYTLPNPEYLSVFNLLVVSLFVYTVLYYYVRKSSALLSQTDGLLRNILPDQVAERLKVSDEMIADEFESASILFADVAGFTPMAAQLTPGEVVNLLNEVFTDFDAMVELRGLEKIKTIGDAYMVAAGVPVPQGDHARAICDLALEMQSHLQSRIFGGRAIVMRIGIASGPVTAGIIGRKKFSYDLWGDTVNLASRMESTGAPGRIQLTAETCDLVSRWYKCEPRGVIEVPGKGRLETWFLIGKTDE